MNILLAHGTDRFLPWLISLAALHGLLKKVRDLGMTLVSVNPVNSSQADVSDIEQQIEES